MNGYIPPFTATWTSRSPSAFLSLFTSNVYICRVRQPWSNTSGCNDVSNSTVYLSLSASLNGRWDNSQTRLYHWLVYNTLYHLISTTVVRWCAIKNVSLSWMHNDKTLLPLKYARWEFFKRVESSVLAIDWDYYLWLKLQLLPITITQILR